MSDCVRPFVWAAVAGQSGWHSGVLLVGADHGLARSIQRASERIWLSMAKKRSARRKKTTRTTTRKKAGAAKQKGLGGISTSELRAELRRRERQMDKLVAKRDKLLADAAELDREISDIAQVIGVAAPGRRSGPGRPAGGGGRRPRNKTTLEEALAQVLNGKTMGVSEVADAVQAAGYQTSAENFRTIVNQTLLRSDRFKKVARGQYTAA